MALPGKAAIIDADHHAVAFGTHVDTPPRTTSKGPPLHEMWLSDPDGTLIEVYTRLTGDELARVDYDQVESLEFTPGLISDSC